MRPTSSSMILLLLASVSGCALGPKADVVIREPGPKVSVAVAAPCVEEVPAPDHFSEETITPTMTLLQKV